MSTSIPNLIRRITGHPVALETTLLVHGVPPAAALDLHRDLCGIVRSQGAIPALIGIVAGVPTVGMTDDELKLLLEAGEVPKANTSNLGALMHRASHAATTVSATMELAAAAGIRLFATGGIGGVHKNYAAALDISSDLSALARFPVAVVSSGVKNILDVAATREALETIGVPVIGLRTDRFPAFYLRDGGCAVDARFDDEQDLAAFIRRELARTGRGILITNPIPQADELDPAQWNHWLAQAEREAHEKNITARAVTPFVLGRLHELSNGATLRANIALVKSNAAAAAKIAWRI
jgi:pseudouridine-5'-phosphate glycosidase